VVVADLRPVVGRGLCWSFFGRLRHSDVKFNREFMCSLSIKFIKFSRSDFETGLNCKRNQAILKLSVKVNIESL